MKSRKKRGFTLVELMASLAVFIILTVTMVSMIMLAIKHNSINKQRYESDLNCKAAIELMKDSSNRPKNKGNRNGDYYFAFDNEADIKGFISKFVDTADGSAGLEQFDSTIKLENSDGLAAAMQKVKDMYSDKKYAIILSSKWNDSNKLYEIELWSWDINKGRPSLINRKILLRPSPDSTT